METLDALARTFDHCATAITAVRPDQMDAPTPCTEWDVRALLTHTIGVVTNIGQGVRGDELIDPNGVALEPDLGAQFRRVATANLEAWRAAGLDAEVNIGAGPMPGGVGASINLVDTAAHTWDIARATGQPEGIPDDLAAAILTAAQSFMSDETRKFAGIDAAVSVGANATPTEAFVAFLGRRP